MFTIVFQWYSLGRQVAESPKPRLFKPDRPRTFANSLCRMKKKHFYTLCVGLSVYMRSSHNPSRVTIVPCFRVKIIYNNGLCCISYTASTLSTPYYCTVVQERACPRVQFILPPTHQKINCQQLETNPYSSITEPICSGQRVHKGTNENVFFADHKCGGVTALCLGKEHAADSKN